MSIGWAAGGHVRGLGREGQKTPGSWWPDWLAWLTAQAPEKVSARKPGEGKLKPLCDAPGDNVRVKA
jgi:polyhydroxyalkanoate synthase